jgi:Fic family protein
MNLDITNTRMRLIITKNSEPRLNNEIILYNIKELLTSFQLKHKDMGTKSNDLINMANFVDEKKNIKFDYLHTDKKHILKSQNMRSKRIHLDEINDEVTRIMDKGLYDPIVLYLHYFIDFINYQPFTSNNELTSYLLIYLLLLKADVYAFRFVSFFELLYDNFEEFETELKKASFNWNEGFSQTLEFVRFMTKLILKAYHNTNEVIKIYEFDRSINKANNIENTILKLPEIFTKEEIRINHPFVSESTINRTLSKLRDEKVIKPLGKGRSAKWIKISSEA